MNKFFQPLALIAILLLIAAGIAAWLLPMQLAHNFKMKMEAETGRIFSVKSGAGWTLQPVPGLVLRDVQLDGISALSAEILSAKTMTLTVAGDVFLDNADVTMAMNDQGHANFLVGDEKEISNMTPRIIHVQNSNFHFLDARAPLKFDVTDISGDFKISPTGTLEGAGSLSLAGRTVQFSGALESLPRLLNDGSPFDVSVDGKNEQFSFAGRLDFKKGLSLAGQTTLDTHDLLQTIAWTGIAFKTLKPNQKLNLNGPIEMQNSDISLKSATVTLANMKGKGDIDLSFANEKPSISTSLGMDQLDLDIFSNTESSSWSEKGFDLQSLQSVNAEFKIAANKTIYQSISSGPAKMTGNLSAGVLTANFNSDAGANIAAWFDGAALEVKTHLEKIAVPLASFTLDADISAKGASEAEMISKLQGHGQVTLSSLQLNDTSGQGAFALEIKDGIAALGENQVLDVPPNLSLQGEIDVLRRSVSISTSALNGKKLLIHGPWLKPETSSIAASLQ
jgi:hypothetical protein